MALEIVCESAGVHSRVLEAACMFCHNCMQCFVGLCLQDRCRALPSRQHQLVKYGNAHTADAAKAHSVA